MQDSPSQRKILIFLYEQSRRFRVIITLCAFASPGEFFFHQKEHILILHRNKVFPMKENKNPSRIVMGYDLAHKDSNLEMTESESVALPFGDGPLLFNKTYYI